MPTNTYTPVDVPAPIVAYFAADTTDAGGVARCFTENGVVIDEHREHRGRHAIARWKTEAMAKYHYTSEPLTAEASGADVTVITRITGQFPGSPIELRYRFTLAGNKIATLEITV